MPLAGTGRHDLAGARGIVISASGSQLTASFDPALLRPSPPDALSVTASHLADRDDREPPLSVRRDGMEDGTGEEYCQEQNRNTLAQRATYYPREIEDPVDTGDADRAARLVSTGVPGRAGQRQGAYASPHPLRDETKLQRHETNFHMDAIGWKLAGPIPWPQQGAA